MIEQYLLHHKRQYQTSQLQREVSQLVQKGARKETGGKSICQNGAVPFPWHNAVYVQISSPSA